MGRSSRADAARHREEVVASTAKLLRGQGSSVSVQDVMATAGMTHGGFYKHFGSKDELMGIAATAAFDELVARLTKILADFPDRSAARDELIVTYLSTDHRDNPSTGCATTALAGDAARSAETSPLRESYVDGLTKVIALMSEYEDADGDTYRSAILDFSTMVGALTLARAAGRTALSDDILRTVRDSLGGQS